MTKFSLDRSTGSSGRSRGSGRPYPVPYLPAPKFDDGKLDHLEDLDDEKLESLEEAFLDDSIEIFEKVDGSIAVLFGRDRYGFWSSKKTGKRNRLGESISNGIEVFYDVHLALESVSRFIERYWPTGTFASADVLDCKRPNTVEYDGKKRIVIHGLRTESGKEYSYEECKNLLKKIPNPEGWEIAIREKLDKKVLTSEHKSAYGNTLSEGLVIKGNGVTAKLVNRSQFTEQNRNYWKYRDLLGRGAFVEGKWQKGLLALFKEAIADEFGNRTLLSPKFAKLVIESAKPVNLPIEQSLFAHFHAIAESIGYKPKGGQAGYERILKGFKEKVLQLESKWNIDSKNYPSEVVSRTRISFNEMKNFIKKLEKVFEDNILRFSSAPIVEIFLSENSIERIEDALDYNKALEKELRDWISQKFGNIRERLNTRDTHGSERGYYSDVYLLDSGRVLKLTTDKTDADASLKVKGKRIPGIITIISVGLIPDKFKREKPIYYIVSEERLRPLPANDAKLLDEAYNSFLGIFNFTVPPYGKVPWEEFKKLAIRKNSQTSGSGYSQGDLDSYFRIYEKYKIPKIAETLIELGIEDYFDFNGGNIMLRGSEPVIIDFGTSSTKDPKKHATLEQVYEAARIYESLEGSSLFFPEWVGAKILLEKEGLLDENGKLLEAKKYYHYSSRKENPEVSDRTIHFGSAGGPRGLYTYQDTAKSHPYAENRRWKFTIVPKDKVLEVEKYSNQDLQRDLNKLQSMGIDIELLKKKWEKFKNNYRGNNLPFAFLWFVVSKSDNIERDADEPISFGAPSTENPAYAKELLLALGHKIIEDTAGIIWSSEPEQTVFLSNDSFEVVDVEENSRWNKQNPIYNEAKGGRVGSTGLTIGRYHPFHKAHAELIRGMAKKYDKVIVCLAGNKPSKDNPFSLQTRKEMIKLSLPDLEDKIELVEVDTGYLPDIIQKITETQKTSLKPGMSIEVVVGQDRAPEFQQQLDRAQQTMEAGPDLSAVRIIPSEKAREDGPSGTQIRKAIINNQKDSVLQMLDAHVASDPASFENLYARLRSELSKYQKLTEAGEPNEDDKPTREMGADEKDAVEFNTLSNRDKVSRILERNKEKIEKRLGAKVLDRIGSGMKGTTYELSDGRVIKITTDIREANSMYLVMEKGNFEHLVKIFDIFMFPGGNNIFGIVQEKLKPLEPKLRSMAEFLSKSIKGPYQNLITLEKNIQSGKEVFNFKNEMLEQQMIAALEVLDLFKIGNALKEAGITNFIDYHGGNLMQRGDKIVLTDIGISEGRDALNKIPVIEQKILFERNVDEWGGQQAAELVLMHNKDELSHLINFESLKYLGAGQHSVVFDAGADRVVKVTGDPKDAAAYSALKGKNYKHLLKVYEAAEVEVPDPQMGEMFVVIAEKLEVIPDGSADYNELKRAMQLFRDLESFSTKLAPILAAGDFDKFFDAVRVEMLKEKQAEAGPRWNKIQTNVLKNIESDMDELWNVMKKYQIPEMASELKQAGIRFADYKADALGKKGNDYVLLDVGGFSDVKRPPKIQKRKLAEVGISAGPSDFSNKAPSSSAWSSAMMIAMGHDDSEEKSRLFEDSRGNIEKILNLPKWIANEFHEINSKHSFVLAKTFIKVYNELDFILDSEYFIKSRIEQFMKKDGKDILEILNRKPQLSSKFNNVKDREEIFDLIRNEKIRSEIPQERILLDLGSGWKWVRLEGDEECRDEGDDMQHCGADTRGDLVSLRDKNNNSYVTMTYDRKNNIIHQIKGKQNKIPDKKYYQPIEKFFEKYKSKIRDSEVKQLDRELYNRINTVSGNDTKSNYSLIVDSANDYSWVHNNDNDRFYLVQTKNVRHILNKDQEDADFIASEDRLAVGYINNNKILISEFRRGMPGRRAPAVTQNIVDLVNSLAKEIDINNSHIPNFVKNELKNLFHQEP